MMGAIWEWGEHIKRPCWGINESTSCKLDKAIEPHKGHIGAISEMSERTNRETKTFA